MAKKDFRAVSHKQPHYPKPSELTLSSLGKLGLAALGGLLLGATGIPMAQAEEPKSTESARSVRAKSRESGVKNAKPAKEATGTPVRPPRFMPNGGKPAPRWREGDGSAAPADHKTPPPKPGQKDGSATSSKTGTDNIPAPPLGGAPPLPRVPEEDKPRPANKGESTAVKTDTATQPEFLPPPGVPPLPRNPEPTPKKSK